MDQQAANHTSKRSRTILLRLTLMIISLALLAIPWFAHAAKCPPPLMRLYARNTMC